MQCDRSESKACPIAVCHKQGVATPRVANLKLAHTYWRQPIEATSSLADWLQWIRHRRLWVRIPVSAVFENGRSCGTVLCWQLVIRFERPVNRATTILTAERQRGALHCAIQSIHFTLPSKLYTSLWVCLAPSCCSSGSDKSLLQSLRCLEQSHLLAGAP